MFNIRSNFTNLGEAFYQYVTPTPLINPKLIHVNQHLAKKLDLCDISDSEWLSIVNGSIKVNNYQPLASVYSGHQFGVWVPQLGDGRAMLIAEHEASNTIYELQLKGSGQTPYSRFADGRAVLRSSIREYLCSHAMQSLGILTTEALAIIDSETVVQREELETASIILRVAPSFIRFGHFEFHASRNQIDELKNLAGFVIDNYYPDCNNKENKISALLDMIVDNTAKTIAKWQSVGFCHGVMNSDNMSILGLTLDYGPFGFLDKYDPNHICNHSDNEGRYSYDNQPQIAWWNLERLAESLTLLTDTESLQNSLSNFAKYFNLYYLKEMGNKLGITNFTIDDLDLLKEVLVILANSNTDWTIFWRKLCRMNQDNTADILKYLENHNAFKLWLDKYLIRRSNQDLTFSQSQELMLSTNPAIVPRNHLAQIAISDAEKGDFRELNQLFSALQTPYEEYDEFAYYYKPPPNWASHINVSCSS